MSISSGTVQPIIVTPEHVVGQIQTAIDTKGNSKKDLGRCNTENWGAGVAGKMSCKVAGIKAVFETEKKEVNEQEKACLQQVLSHRDATGLTEENLIDLEDRKIDVIVQTSEDPRYPQIHAWFLGVKTKNDAVSLEQGKLILEQQVKAPHPTLNEVMKESIIKIPIPEKEMKHCFPANGVEFTEEASTLKPMTAHQFLVMTGNKEASQGCCDCSGLKNKHIWVAYPAKSKEKDSVKEPLLSDSSSSIAPEPESAPVPSGGGSSHIAPLRHMLSPGSVDIIIP